MFMYGLVHSGIFLNLITSLSAFYIAMITQSETLLGLLSDEKCWEDYLAYKTRLISSGKESKELEKFIAAKAYLPVCEMIKSGGEFPLPKRSVISKMSSTKKRTVYTYPPAENMVLKLLTYLMLRKYDGLFSDGLFSFRPGHTAKDAVRRILAFPGIGAMYSYKADVSNYFNSIPMDGFIPVLKDALSDDPELFSFLGSLLLNEAVLERGRVFYEKKGIMAGTPVASFYANLYLAELDLEYDRRSSDGEKVIYSRYSDDIIVFAESREKIEAEAGKIREFLKSRGLRINKDKESFAGPEEGFSFLGFYCRDKKVDIAPATIKKLKGKMRRKTRSLMRWKKRNELEGERSAKAFIRIFNRKLLESPVDNELSWAYWFFPLINTTESLGEIDHYAQECLRYLLSDSRRKSRFNVRYEDLKKLGYKSLVHEYYKF